MDKDIKEITVQLIHSFTLNSCDKWSLLDIYYSKFLCKKDFDKAFLETYTTVISTLLDILQPTLFNEEWQENLFNKIFLDGIPHESLMMLVKRLDDSEQYVKQKIVNLLQKFIQPSVLENLFLHQCLSSSNWNLKYVSKSNLWEHLITTLTSLPDRVSNVTKGKNVKVFCPTYYIPLIMSTVFRALHSVYRSVKDSQDCTLEFLAKLTGRICFLGKADIVAKIYLKKSLNLSKSDYVWRRISQNFIRKMPSNSLDSFITSILLQIPWYRYIEWILGDEGIKHEKINYIMTVKLLFHRSFKSVILLQNIIGYFASSSHSSSDFIKILDSLLDLWTDEKSLRHQSIDQQIYIASALMIYAGWLKQLQLKLNNQDYINKVLKGTQIRLAKSENIVQSIGMIVAQNLNQAFDPSIPALEFEFPDIDLLNSLKDLQKIPEKPDDSIISFEDLKYFDEIEELNKCDRNLEENKMTNKNFEKDLDSDDDLEPYDMSSDVPECKVKRPLYLHDCLMGLIQQDNMNWTESCLRHAEELILANPYATEEVAEEMAKIMLHLTDDSFIPDFVGLRHKILITLTKQCPLVVASYLISQFTERDYTIRQRLDILEVIAASSASIAYSKPSETCSTVSLNKHSRKGEPEWQLIVNQRLSSKTKHYTKAQEVLFKENKFSAIAKNFFYPLLNSYEKACQILKLHGDDSYVLGRLISTLGIIMYSASNTLYSSQMGTSLLQFLHSVRTHEDVFVRKSIIFAVAATYTAVPSSILFTEMLSDVTDMTQWLQSIAENDFDLDCIEKAFYALSIFQSAAAEGSSLHLLKNLSN